VTGTSAAVRTETERDLRELVRQIAAGNSRLASEAMKRHLRNVLRASSRELP
jgi:DNA-binding GntR family transcriptional regulator